MAADLARRRATRELRRLLPGTSVFQTRLMPQSRPVAAPCPALPVACSFEPLASYAFRTSHMIGTGAFTTPDKLLRVAW
jgi:hypothetical protein